MKNNCTKGRNGFIFYRSFRDALNNADESTQLLIYKAIADYALDFVKPDSEALGQIGRLCWALIEPTLKRGVDGYQNGIKGASYGSLGGAPKNNKNACKQKNNPQNNPQNNRRCKMNDVR